MIVINNFFNDVDDIRKIALSAKYYTKDNHPGDIAKFPGHRTDYLNEWNNDLYNRIAKTELELVKKIEDLSLFTEYWTKISFSWTDDSIPRIPHVDFSEGWNGFKKFYGGIIYLTPNPPKNTGTIIWDNDKETIIDNVYNRYVMYDATKLHAIENSFGNCLESGRLVLTHFIYLK